MSLALKKSLPKPGNRYALPALYGSSDAYALALAALELKSRGQMLAVVVAQASDGQRLLDEIPWFGGAQLRCHLLPDWETLPYDAFSPHQDLVSERLATLHEIQNRQCDVLIVPATTALTLEPQLIRLWREGRDPNPQLKPIDWKRKPLASLAILAVVRYQMHRLSRGHQPKAKVAPCMALVRDQWFLARRTRQYRAAMTQSSH